MLVEQAQRPGTGKVRLDPVPHPLDVRQELAQRSGHRATEHAGSQDGHPAEPAAVQAGGLHRPNAAASAFRQAAFSSGRPTEIRNHSGRP